MPGSAVSDARDTQTVRVLRGMLLAVFFLGTLGTGIELMLLGHYAELPQLIPGGMILLALAFLAAWILIRGRVILRVFQVFMFLFVASGTLGIYLHYQSNVEFELEMNPSATRRELIWESLTGAMPLLAPGTMVQLGVVGLLYTFRHPIFSVTRETERSSHDAYEAHDDM